LTSRLIRLEYSSTEQFEDRPSQVFWHRRQPVPQYTATMGEGRLEIATEQLRLRYKPGGAGFAADSLSIELLGSGVTWHYGDRDPRNLEGTARTLDKAGGRIKLEPGLVSRSGWSLVDDSASLVFDADGWIAPRGVGGRAGGAAGPRSLDLYFFGYGCAYEECLCDFRKVAGQVPLLPRWALGNWWSRYWAYSQDELIELMLEFERHEVPLSVCVVDVDWHIVFLEGAEAYQGARLPWWLRRRKPAPGVPSEGFTSGWAGYTWNRDLFPDPDQFLCWLHGKGLHAGLNLHPAEGVHPHEARYAEMARALGIDPSSRTPVAFDIAEPRFARAYFEILHHPLEQQGVDFWWIDWQAGQKSTMPGLDPLWWLNHLHFYDLGRDGRRRPLILSRWGGLGNHRYPIGFSGDAVVTWESLAFQPYFTATAANVGFGWWSHDIGGHVGGIEEPELYARWVQLGVFSPILRLHAAKSLYHDRRPWVHGADVLRVAREAMQLRHALIPYLYTMAWRDHSAGIPLVRPMYHSHPRDEEAYHCPDQYYFGSELVVAPHVKEHDHATRLSRQVAWLPAGDWFDFFSGQHYPGGGWHARYGDLDDLPVWARAGAIVPLGPRTGWGGIENPDHLVIHVFGGADNRFELYEDEGETARYASGHGCVTEFSQAWQGGQLEFRILPARGDVALIPAARQYTLLFKGICRPSAVFARLNGSPLPLQASYDAQTETLSVGPLAVGRDDEFAITLAAESASLLSKRDRAAETCRRLLWPFRLDPRIKGRIDRQLDEILADPNLLGDYSLYLQPSQAVALAETVLGRALDRR